MQLSRRNLQRGLTLIELLISSTLGLLLVLSLATLFVQSNRSYKQNDAVTAMQDQARFSLQTLSRDLMSAGYWGGLASPDDISINASVDGLLPANDCGADAGTAWAKLTDARLEFLDNPDAASASGTYRCIAQSSFVSGTDVVAIRRVSAQAADDLSAVDTTATLAAYGFYLQTNGVAGTLFRMAGTTSYTPAAPDLPLAPPMRFYKYRPRIYYIRNWTFNEGDGVPSLCRQVLNHAATPSIANECLGIGVQDLQLTWGLDTDGDEKQLVDRYLTNPSTEQIDDARTLRIEILVRSRTADPSYLNEKSYTLGGTTVTYEAADEDHFRRRRYSTTIQLRNQYL